jgi:hypothetical protein
MFLLSCSVTRLEEPMSPAGICLYGANTDYDSKARLLISSEWPGKGLPEKALHGEADQLPVTLLAIVEETVVGCGSIVLQVSPGSLRLSTWLCDLVVRPDFRNRGIATRIITNLMRHPARPRAWALHALTKRPSLFLRLGWTVAGISDGMSTQGIANLINCQAQQGIGPQAQTVMLLGGRKSPVARS